MFKKILLALMALAAACSPSKKPESEKPSVLVSIAPYAFFVEKIAGDTVEIQTLIPPGTNLHIYEPSPKTVEKNAQAAIWFRIDEPIERQIVVAFAERSPKMKMVNLQEGLPLMKDNGAVELSPCLGHHHDVDLHTWLSPKLALKQAQKIADNLIELLPQNRELYQKNFNALALEMVNLDKEIAKKLVPFRGEAILVSHPAFAYFCENYGLKQLSVECEGKDPRPKDVEEILKRAKSYHVRCVFLQQGFNNRGAQLIGQKLGLPNYRVDPYARDYLSNMRQISGYIAK